MRHPIPTTPATAPVQHAALEIDTGHLERLRDSGACRWRDVRITSRGVARLCGGGTVEGLFTGHALGTARGRCSMQRLRRGRCYTCCRRSRTGCLAGRRSISGRITVVAPCDSMVRLSDLVPCGLPVLHHSGCQSRRLPHTLGDPVGIPPSSCRDWSAFTLNAVGYWPPFDLLLRFSTGLPPWMTCNRNYRVSLKGCSPVSCHRISFVFPPKKE